MHTNFLEQCKMDRHLSMRLFNSTPSKGFLPKFSLMMRKAVCRLAYKIKSAMFPYICHGFAKNRNVQQLEEVFLNTVSVWRVSFLQCWNLGMVFRSLAEVVTIQSIYRFNNPTNVAKKNLERRCVKHIFSFSVTFKIQLQFFSLQKKTGNLELMAVQEVGG